jgi:uncharacterized protein (TIGR03546 family)
MFWLQIVSKFIKILRAGQTPNQIAGGFALGSILGLSPMLTIQGIMIWFVIFLLDVNLSAAFLSLSVFSLIAYLFDPLFHVFGYYLLVEVEPLQGFWTSLYNAPIAPLTRFNNTVVLGSLISALVLAVPVFFGMRHFVLAYRTHIGARLEQTKLYRVIAGSSLVRWYQRLRDIGGTS